jgi:imidazolonepropionase-like amidohydrolase
MLLAGTQSSTAAVGTPGVLLHDELRVYVMAGLSPFDALAAATTNPARFMGRERELGTIEKGKLADLVLLNANPLANISNTRSIAAVIANGRYLSRDALDELLARAEAIAAQK